MLKFIAAILLFTTIHVSAAVPNAAPAFDHVFIIVFENKNASDVMKYPFFKEMAQRGANLTKMNGVVHPSQGNYIAMVSGDTYGVNHDNPVNLSGQHIGDLLESKGRTWKLYAEDYPGNCFTGKSQGRYVRKHVPFISFTNVSGNKQRCGSIKNASEFTTDLANRNLPDYVFYTPNMDNDGHDTSLDYSNKYLESKFGTLFRDPNFLSKTLVVITFDESESFTSNSIYTVLLGANIAPGSATSQNLNHYSILKMIEDTWNLGNLGRKDATAVVPAGIWK